MPFVGSDWRAPGDKWIRTEFGWKRLSDIHSALQRQIGRMASSVKAQAGKRGGAGKLRSRSGSPGSSTSHSRASSRPHSPVKFKTCHASYYALDEQRLTHLQLALAQRCISARGSSRESNLYATMSDAINKLNFSQALHDMNCFPFICEVMEKLVEDRYWTLSGSMQTTLMRLTFTAKDIAIERQQQTGYIVSVLDKQLNVMEAGRSRLTTGFSLSRLDTKIKSLRSYRSQLLGQFQDDENSDVDKLPYLPNECWRHVISFLSDPKDVLRLGCVNRLFYFLVKEDWVWISLTEYHYGNDIPLREEGGDAIDVFKTMYWSSGKTLKSTVFSAVVHCGVCDYVYWRNYSHPCSELGHSSSVASLAANSQEIKSGLTAKQFITLFLT